jgi:hypothetical protein
VHDPDDHSFGTRYWHDTVDGRLSANGLSVKQVEVVWLKEVDPRPGLGFPEYPKKLEQEQYDIVRVLAKHFPNIKLCYISSRTYGGYALVTGSPEPYAYEGGFAVKWLIEEQIKGNPELNFDPRQGPVKSPWLSWGPYMWANGMHKRSDGLFYERADYGGDGMHPSQKGRTKIANQLLEFLKKDPTARLWFVAR